MLKKTTKDFIKKERVKEVQRLIIKYQIKVLANVSLCYVFK